jgi:LCP family protein required for cell wall assembly
MPSLPQPSRADHFGRHGGRRRRRRSAQASFAFPRLTRRNALAGGLLLTLALGGLLSVRVWGLIHGIAPHTRAGDVLALVAPRPSNQPGTLGWKVAHNERTNILLMGYGGPGHDGPYLTDSMMLVSLLPKTHQMVLISLPRDLWVRIPAFRDRTYDGKLNEAYEIGIDDASWLNKRPEYTGRRTAGGDLAASVVGTVTGLQVDYWVGVDFKAFEDVVNALGGIDVTVDQVLHDTQFPRGETTAYMTVHVNAGPQHLSGERALQFARSRYSTNDFDRSKRQQKILLAVRERTLSLDAIPRLLGLFDAIQKNVITNFTVPDLRIMADQVKMQREEDIHRIAIDNTNLLRESTSRIGQYILLPRDKSFAALREYLDRILVSRAVLKEGATVQVLNGTDRYPAQPGTAAETWTDLLVATGLRVVPAGDATHKRYTVSEVHDYSGGRAPETVAWLASVFRATVVQETAEAAPSTRVVVILGSEFTLRTFSGV